MPVLVQRAMHESGYDVRASWRVTFRWSPFGGTLALWRTNTSLCPAVERIEMDEVIAKQCATVATCSARVCTGSICWNVRTRAS
jgi:hypothetical protein